MLILQHVGDFNPGNIVETIFKLVIGSKGRGEGYGKWITGSWISGNMINPVVSVKSTSDIAVRCVPNFLVRSFCNLTLIKIGHARQSEGIAS